MMPSQNERLPESPFRGTWPEVADDAGLGAVVVRAVTSPEDPEWIAFVMEASDRDLDNPDLIALAACKPGRNGAERTTAYLLKRAGSERAEVAAILETTPDHKRLTQTVSVAALLAQGSGDGTDLFGLAGDCLVDEIRRDLRWWEGKVPAGGSLKVTVGPGPDGSHDGRLALMVAEAVETYPVEPGIESTLDYAVSVDVRDLAGRPCHLPELSRLAAPTESRESWDLLLREADALLYENVSQVRLRLEGGAVAVRNEEDEAVDDATWLMESPQAQEALAEILSDADLGRDAVLVVSWDYRAVFAAGTWESGDWSTGFGATLVETDEADRVSRRRDVRRFWTAFPTELATVLRHRREAGTKTVYPVSKTAH